MTTEPITISGGRLTCLISNAHRLLGRRYKGILLWVLVRDITGSGSGFAADMCRQAGFEPNQPCGSKHLLSVGHSAMP